jgi:hypothetical protein
MADGATAAGIARDAEREAARALAAAAAPPVEAGPVWADGPNAEPLEPLPDGVAEAGEWDVPQPAMAPDAGLADRLCAARECAEAARHADVRSRGALYRALGHAYDFALAAEAEPGDYAEILADAGLKGQKRAPMTPVVKLVFGADCDKSRLTEFAAALSWAKREALEPGSLPSYLEAQPGGLKALVRSERRVRRPEPKPDSGEAAREALRHAAAIGFIDIDSAEEFVLLLARRDGDGRVAVIAAVPDQPLTDRAIRKAAA